MDILLFAMLSIAFYAVLNGRLSYVAESQRKELIKLKKERDYWKNKAQ